MDEDGMRKVLQQLELKARETGRSLNLARAQVSSKERDRRIAEITANEVAAIPEGQGKLYRGVGKMFVLETRADVQKLLKAEQKEAADELAALRKKQKFLEQEFQQTQASVQDIFKGPRH